ncbi:hypothetical protein, partial [Vibrio vulnificus]|uniref:hypothetical protein n=1 Tax=Vibrio vulnificus TaxID=672 RepID=UPI001A924AFD
KIDFPDFNFRKKSAIFYIFWKSVPRRRQAKVSRKVPEWNIKSNSSVVTQSGFQVIFSKV